MTASPSATGTSSLLRSMAPHAVHMAAILSEAERLARFDDLNRLTREAVEFAREVLGLERVSLYLSFLAPTHVEMRGTWGTDDSGHTTDERGVAHRCCDEDFLSLHQLHGRGALWQYRGSDSTPDVPWRSTKSHDDRAWLAVTPLVATDRVVGVMYNDTAISRTPLDASKQANLAVFGSLLSNLARDRMTNTVLDRKLNGLTKPSRFIGKVLAALEQDPQVTGEALAQRFHVSPGHLTRTFKLETGASLVEYRNRMRLERFFGIVQRGHKNLLEAALEAGFGSYAQFHRVHRRATGTAPRQYPSSTRDGRDD